jgi:hypothetical protein
LPFPLLILTDLLAIFVEFCEEILTLSSHFDERRSAWKHRLLATYLHIDGMRNHTFADGLRHHMVELLTTPNLIATHATRFVVATFHIPNHARTTRRETALAIEFVALVKDRLHANLASIGAGHRDV